MLKILSELTKIRLVFLTVLSAMVGFYLAPAPFRFDDFIWMTLGTGLAAAGAMALNEWMERDEDSRMKRTQNRPLPAGKIQPAAAFWIGFVFCLAGLALLILTGLALCALVTIAIVGSYLFAYTPAKKKSSLNTILGAIPGALPPVAGWAASAGAAPFQAWVLASIIFLWQLPHFLSLAWVYREDYEKAGFVMLTVEEKNPSRIREKLMLYTFALVPVSLLPSLTGMTGKIYFFGALALGMLFCWKAVRDLRDLDKGAKPFFLYSVFYLFLMQILMVIDKA
ncbi:MAG TPA: protoheme IX farnesyltransferase [Candidatus Omnitrophica bacterium]|nr:protoheme IX farnesyltransferase [Candidatus Omnitrophota bacterium]